MKFRLRLDERLTVLTNLEIYIELYCGYFS